MRPNSSKILIIGISGGSGSGKSTLAKALMQRLGTHDCEVLAQDHYYIDQSARFDGDGGSVNFDHPDSLEFPLLARHLALLQGEESVEVPRYDFATHKRLRETETFVPCRYILVDGTLILSQEIIRPHLGFSVFVETPENVRFERRLDRDVRERGRTPEGVRAQFEKQVKPMHDKFIEPSKRHANLVISGMLPIEEEVERILKIMPR